MRAEGSIWTDRLVSALATASKEHVANAPSLRMGGSPVALPLRRRDTPDVETNDWRAVCGRTARTVRRAGKGYTPSRPLSRQGLKCQLRGIGSASFTVAMVPAVRLQRGFEMQ